MSDREITVYYRPERDLMDVLKPYLPTYRKVGGLHFVRWGRLGFSFFVSK